LVNLVRLLAPVNDEVVLSVACSMLFSHLFSGSLAAMWQRCDAQAYWMFFHAF
jgi:hypothetical protein